MNVTFVSFYTRNSGYEKEVKNLKISCQKFNLFTDIVPIDSQGTWEKNCFYKSRFLLKMFEKHQKPIVWVDADAIIVQKPLLFETLTEDIGVRVLHDFPPKHYSKVLSGTIYLNNTQNTYKLLQFWERESQELIKNKEDKLWDQIALQNAILKMGKLSVFYLPPEYGDIYDHPLSQNPVILHYQASRILKYATYNLPVPPRLEAFQESESINRSLHRSIILKKYGIIS